MFTKKYLQYSLAGLLVGVLAVVGIKTAFTFQEPSAGPSGFEEPSSSSDQGDWLTYGRGWVASSSGDASTALTKAACESASNWEWFEDGNGDGDYTDQEDGICVKTTTVTSLSWNGYDYTTDYDNSYIAAYECEGSFPTGTIAAGSYNGLTSAGAADTTWNDGDCALCQADCYDGRRDLPTQGSYTSNSGGTTGYQGPIDPEVLENWKGTRLPSTEDYYGFCGNKYFSSGYETGCSSTISHGNYGQMVGRTDECIDLSNTGNIEWLNNQYSNNGARVSGGAACSYFYGENINVGRDFRAVFRP